MRKMGIASLVLALAMAGSARAQRENIEGFTVVGKSFLKARPDLVEIDLSVSAGSELSADAIVKYRDARRKVHEAFAALKLGNVAIEERGLRVDQKGMDYNPYFGFGGMPNQRSKTEVQLSRKLVVRGKDLRKMDEDAVLQLVAKLLDVAQDAGAHVGTSQEENSYYYWRYDRTNNTLARFVIEDFDKIQEEAYEKAIADARKRAERLARLSKVELGPIVAIQELVVPGDVVPSPNNNFYYGPFSGSSDDDHPRKRLETTKFQEIPVRVELLVRFDIRSKPEVKERTTQR